MGETVTFKTADGVDLVGYVRGNGKTAVVLSAMCYNTPTEDWDDFARLLDKEGYMSMTYLYRGIKPSGGNRTTASLEQDIAAAVQYVKSRGAEHIVLAGGSCGGTMSVLEASKTPIEALVVLASPQAVEGVGATDEALAKVTVPKLFVASQDDQFTAPMLAMFDKLPDPKEKHIYPGSVHGTSLFATDYGDDLTQRLLTFIKANAPAR
jgi:esterase/lipase